MKRLNSSTALLIIVVLFAISSCGNETGKEQATSIPLNQSDTAVPSQPVQPSGFPEGSLSMQTFEVKDSASGKSKGWGYDIYIDGHKTIHQPILPGVPGTKSFASEEKAKITGNYVLNRMMKAGSFVAVTEKELDSLGIIKK